MIVRLLATSWSYDRLQQALIACDRIRSQESFHKCDRCRATELIKKYGCTSGRMVVRAILRPCDRSCDRSYDTSKWMGSWEGMITISPLSVLHRVMNLISLSDDANYCNRSCNVVQRSYDRSYDRRMQLNRSQAVASEF